MIHDTGTIHTRPEGAFGSIKNLIASLVSHLHTRWQLFATELAEEKVRLITLLYCTLLTLFFTFMVLILTILFILAAFWDTPYRLHSVGALGVVFLVGAGICGSKVSSKLKSKPRLFAASLAELYKDRQQLNAP